MGIIIAITIITILLGGLAIVFGICQHKLGGSFDMGWAFAAGFCAFWGVVGLITVLVLVVEWNSSSYRAEVFNRKYGTSYTAKEFFWAGETIRTMVEGTYQRSKIQAEVKMK